jgi:hypothetical protein
MQILWNVVIILSLVNHFAFDIHSRVLLIRGSRYQSFFMIIFNMQ